MEVNNHKWSLLEVFVDKDLVLGNGHFLPVEVFLAARRDSPDSSGDIRPLVSPPEHGLWFPLRRVLLRVAENKSVEESHQREVLQGVTVVP